MTIAEVSRAYDISADTLRYYERVGLLPSIGRTSGGIRNYSEEDCRWVELRHWWNMWLYSIREMKPYRQGRTCFWNSGPR